jgi:hypothetical protein
MDMRFGTWNVRSTLRAVAEDISIYNLHIGYWWESQKVRDHWEDLDVGGWPILKWILER